MNRRTVLVLPWLCTLVFMVCGGVSAFAHVGSTFQACDLVPNTTREYPVGESEDESESKSESESDAESGAEGASKAATTSRLPHHAQRMSVGHFNQVMRLVQEAYEPEFRKHGAILMIRGLWKDATINAFAYPGRDPFEIAEKKNAPLTPSDLRYRRVDIFGGLARHPAMSVDALLMATCHEVGHHLGGLPIKAGFWGASNEGQSDYFAAVKCMRRVLRQFDNAELVRHMPIDPLVRSRCVAAHLGAQQDAAICMRSAMAGLSLASVLGDLNEEPRVLFTTPDRSIVDETDNKHPAAQCRLDTYYQGALCRVDYTVDMTLDNPIQGSCTPDQATGASGFRPACWFHPKYYERPELLPRH